MVDNLSIIPNSSSKYTLPSNGFYSASVSANLINQFLLTAAIETELNLTPNEQSHFGIYNQNSSSNTLERSLNIRKSLMQQLNNVKVTIYSQL